MSWSGPFFLVLGGASSDLSVSGPGVLVQQVNAGAVTEVAAPGADSLFGWDNIDAAYHNISIGSGLSYNHGTHTLSSTGGGSGISLPQVIANNWMGF